MAARLRFWRLWTQRGVTVKKFNTYILLICTPLFVQIAQEAQAAGYTFDCESSSEGQEAICFADPGEDLYAAETGEKLQPLQSQQLTKEQKLQAQAAFKRPLIFGPDQDLLKEPEKELPGVPTAKRIDVASLKNMLRTQEEIRSIEIFLQPTRGPGGLGTADEFGGPTVSNTK
jgi:hypothetical protein